MTYKILWYKKAVYHISYDIVFVIFWFTRNWTTQTEDHMNFGKSIPMVVDFATSLALYISLSCWRHNRFALNHWKLATRCYQFPEHQETMPSASPQTPPSHWLDGDIKGTLALVKTRLWFGFQIPALNLMAGDSFDMWEWHDQENVISENMQVGTAVIHGLVIGAIQALQLNLHCKQRELAPHMSFYSWYIGTCTGCVLPKASSEVAPLELHSRMVSFVATSITTV